MVENPNSGEVTDPMESNVIQFGDRAISKKAIDTIQRQVEERTAVEAEKYGSSDDGGGSDVSSGFVRDCLRMNELGDGLLFRELHRGKFVFNKAMDAWMVWGGHYWDVDTMDLAKSSVENVVAKYIREAMRVSAEIRELNGRDEDKERALKSLRDLLNSRVSALRSTRRRNNCLGFAHTCDDPLAIHGNEIDRAPWLLACENGVVELESGEFRPGRPDDFLYRHATAEWRKLDEPAPGWENFLAQVMDEEHLDPKEGRPMCEFLQRLLGHAIVGATAEHIFSVFEGMGRNGKGVIQRMMIHVLGNLAGPVRSEMLLDQSRNMSSAGPTPDLMTLRGLRVAFASETDEGCRVSASRVKWMTGGDELSGRNPHDKYEITWTPTHSLFLMTNHKPNAPPDDFAFWQRMHLVPFKLSFIKRAPKRDNERPADPDLENRLIAESSGILAWLVRGCLQWQKIGLDPPPQVLKANQQYQADEDNVGAFIDHCCYLDPDNDDLYVGATPLYEAFEAWWTKFVSRYPMKQKKFGTAMRKRLRCEKVGGVYRYYGIGLLASNDEEAIPGP
jgi:putative DNA primase/helicase